MTVNDCTFPRSRSNRQSPTGLPGARRGGSGINKTIDIRNNKTDNLPMPCRSVNYNDTDLYET